MYGGGGQDIFYDILTMFEVDNSAEDAYTDDFEIARSGLQQLRKHISEQDETFRQNAEEFYSCLAKVIFLTDNGVKSWDEWHRAHTDAARGECRYRKRCPVYGRSKHLMNNK